MRHRIAPALAVALLAIGLPFGPAGWAGGEDARPAPAGNQGRDDLSEEEADRLLEQLRTLGYVAWDEDADAKLRGVTRHDAERAEPGYNLYTNLADEVILMDLGGERVHTWRLPPGTKECQDAELLPDGNLILICVGHGLMLMDWDSKPIFDLEMPAHHDVTALPNGKFLVPYKEMQPYKGRRVVFDGIAIISARGEVLGQWSTYRHLRKLQRLHAPSDLDEPAVPGKPPPRVEEKGMHYYHINTVDVLPETPLGKRDTRFRAGNLLVCFRNVNLVLVLDRIDYSVLWHWGADVLDLPHTPRMLDNGHILIFDNGTYRGSSRVLEIDPPSGEIVWKYEADPPESFFSKWCGSSQRLGNGNTLICDSWHGRAFEVTRGGEIVWEFWNPEIVDGKRKRFYKFTRLSPSLVEPLLEKHGKMEK